MPKRICSTCEGQGEIYSVTNYYEHYYEGDWPVIENKYCEDCGGTGYELQEEMYESEKYHYIVELLKGHSKESLKKKIDNLKKQDGEDWAIGETINRILETIE